MSNSWTSPGDPRLNEATPVEWNTPGVTPTPVPAFEKSPHMPNHDAPPSLDSPPQGTNAAPGQDEEIPNSPLPQSDSEPAMTPPAVDPALIMEVQHQLALLASALDEVATANEEEQQRMVNQVLELGLALAGELAGGAIEIEPERLSGIVKEALTLMEEGAIVHVRIHPEIFGKLNEADLLEDLKNNPRIQIHQDRRIGEIGCVIENQYKRVDARVQSRIKQVRHLLKQELEGRVDS